MFINLLFNNFQKYENIFRSSNHILFSLVINIQTNEYKTLIKMFFFRFLKMNFEVTKKD